MKIGASLSLFLSGGTGVWAVSLQSRGSTAAVFISEIEFCELYAWPGL
jgi:hypothetical protein